MESFANFGGGGGSSSTSKATFLQFPLPAAALAELIPPDAHGSSPLALHQLLAGPSSAPPGHRKGEALVQGEISPADADTIKTKIMSHPQYSALLAAYLDCHKVGDPPDVLDRLSVVAAKQDANSAQGRRQHEPWRADPELDQFMEAYCNMLVKYREELARPIQEATEFFKSVETQLDSFTDSNCEGAGSSEDDRDTSRHEGIDAYAEDKELKHRLLRKYGGHLGSLRQEFSKRKKKGKLPNDARQKLLRWWELHHKWPYPSETEKMALAESTGLDQKQISNWFINQRKRHWKPASEDMPPPSMTERGFHHVPQGTAALYMGGPPFTVDGMYRLGGS